MDEGLQKKVEKIIKSLLDGVEKGDCSDDTVNAATIVEKLTNVLIEMKKAEIN